MSNRSIRSGYAHVPSQALLEGGTLRRPAIGRTARQALLLGTALGCSIAVFSLGAPGTARAADECGGPTVVAGVDQVTCGSGSFPTGITYIDSSGNPIFVTLQSGVTSEPVGVTVGNTGSNAYTSVVVDAGATVIDTSGTGLDAYTTGGGNVYVRNYGEVFGENIGINASATSGNVYVRNDYIAFSSGTQISAVTGGGNVEVHSNAYMDVLTTVNPGVMTGINTVAVSGTVSVYADAVRLESSEGYVIGLTAAATYTDLQKVYGNVTVIGYTGALGVKTSSANNAYTVVYGDVNASSGLGGNGGGNATGIITVGSNFASTYVSGNVTVTAVNGVALGVESSSLNGSYVDVGGSVTATGDLGATAVYDRTIYDHNAGVTVGGNVGAYSSQGTATGVFAAAGNAVANAGTYVDVTVSGDVTVHGYTAGIGVVAENLGGAVDVDIGGDVTVTSAQGVAVGVESVVPGTYDNTVMIGGNVYAKGRAGAYGVVAEGGDIYVGITGDVTVIATAGNAIGVYTFGDNSVHIGGNASAFASGNAIAVQVGGADGYAYVGGNVTAVSTGTGNAEGFYGNATGDVGAHIVGNVYAKAVSGTAFGVAGISSGGNVTLYVGGDVYAGSTQGVAGGVIGESADNTITVNGSVVARGYTGAVGVESYGNGTVHIGGDVGAYSKTGNAYGVGIVGTSGYAYVGGNITVISGNTTAGAKSAGFYGNVTGDVSGHIDGSVSAMGANGTTFGVAGISTGGGDVTLYVGGNVYAGSAQGVAGGVVGESAYNTITVNGNVVARGYSGAVGVESYGNGTVHIGGDVEAYSKTGNAYGVGIVGTSGYAYVGGNITVISGNTTAGAKSAGFYGNVTGDVSGHIDGSVSAMGANGTTFGVAGISTGGGDVTLYVGGNVYAGSAQGVAGGVVGESADNTITVNGGVVARGYTGAVGVESYGNGTVHIGGDVGAYSKTGNAYGVGIVGTSGYAYVGGNITVVSGNTTAGAKSAGFYGNVTGDVSGHIDGNVSAMGANGTTFGVAGISTGGGDVTLYVGGNVYAGSAQGVAGGVVGESADNTITVNGNVVARGYTGAVGVESYGNGTVHIGGDVGAYSKTGNAYGVGIVGTSGYAYVGGNITVISGNTTAGAKSAGFYGNVTGDVSGHIDGSVSAMGANGTTFGVAGISTGGGDVTLFVGGNVYAGSAQGVAGGVVGESADNTITVNGSVVARGYTGAVGVESYGNGTVHIGGDVGAYSKTGNAYGVGIVGTSGYAYVGGNVTVISGNTTAGAKSAGFYGNVTGDVSGHIDGNDYAKGANGVTFGAAGISSGGNVTLYVGGNVYAGSTLGGAGGVIAVSGQTNTITVGGNVVANGYTTAIGVGAAGGDINITVGGGAYAIANLGNATGVYANTTGYVDVHVGGTVFAYSKQADAIGVNVVGDSTVYVGGNAVALAPLGNATAATLTSSGDGYVTVHENVYAKGGVNATGVYNKSYDQTTVSVGGDVTALAGTGNATGVHAYSKYGYGNVSVGGGIVAEADGTAIGVRVAALTSSTLSVGGNVTADSLAGYAAAVQAFAEGNVTVDVGGTVKAFGATAAYGFYVGSGGHADITVGGDVIAMSGTGSAWGVRSSGETVDVTIHGNVVAYSSSGGIAIGASALTNSDATITVDGNVYAKSASGAVAVGLEGLSFYGGVVDITVGGTTVAIGSLAYGVFGESLGGGNVTVDVGDVVVHQYNATTPTEGAGIVTYTTGVTDITAGNVSTTGAFTDGVRAGEAGSNNGDTAITLTAVETTGDYSPGVYVSGLGNATVTIGTAYTKGYKSDGVYAYSSAGGVSVTSTMVKTLGDYSAGVYAKAGGPVVVNSGTSVTFGDFAPAVAGINSGTTPTDTVAIYSGNAITHGNYSIGVYASSYSGTYVKSGLVMTYGKHSDGIYAYSSHGPVTVNSTTVVTYGDYSYGISAVAEKFSFLSVPAGPVVVNSGTVVTYGFAADGIYAIDSGNTASDTITINSGNVITHGDFSPGIYTYSLFGTTINSDLIVTHGLDSPGINAAAYYGPITISSNTVRTYGNFSDGIEAYDAYGAVTINSYAVTTAGYLSMGIHGKSYFGDIDINSTYVHTSGDLSAGIFAYTFQGDVNIVSNTVLTDGNFSTGIFGLSEYANVNIASGYVRTLGYKSDGIIAESYLGDIYIDSNTVRTYGDLSYGIFADAIFGNVDINSGYVSTQGFGSIGVVGLSFFGDVTIESGGVITHGDYADGVYGIARYGTVDITSDYVRTYGYHSEGIHAEGYYGVTVNSGTVITSGAYADGIHAISSDGVVDVTSEYVRTSGTGSIGIYAYGEYGANVNSGTVKTYGDFATGILVVSPYGTASVTSNYVQTTGAFAPGINAYGFYGATVNNTGLVRTYGYKSDGIMANAYFGDVTVTSDEVVTYGDYSRGIAAETLDGNVSVTVSDEGGVFTYGYAADAVYAVSLYGTVTVNNDGVIKTSGDFSDGVFAASVAGGNVYVNNYGDIITEGFDAPGIYAFANGGQVDVYNGGLIRTYGEFSTGVFAAGVYGSSVVNDGVIETYGAFADGIEALALTGDVYVRNNDFVYTYGFDSTGIEAEVVGSGTAEVVNTGEVIAYQGIGVLAEGTFAEVYNFGYIYGGHGGIIVDSSDGSYIYNKGVIKGGNGFAIGAYGASVLIENKGAIYGYARLYTSNNTVNNQGHWFAYGNSYFGYGGDTFNNKGIVEVAPFSVAPTTVTWSGLTVFNNSNLVDLRNGHTGDVFNLIGNGGVGTIWNGLAGSTLGVDASLSASLTSDRMNVGAVNGTTALVVNDTTPTLPGTLNFVGTTVVHGTSGTASNFTWVGRTKGFINYELDFFSGLVDWNIVALPSNAAFEMLKAPEMAQDFWRRTGDAWTAREQEVRDSMWGSTPPTRGEGWEMWAQAQIGGERLDRIETFDVQGMSFSPNLSTDTDWRGFQMGGDNWTSKNWLWGFTGGFLEQNTSFHFDKNSFDITGWNVGAYTGFTSGAFFANGLIKADWYDVKANMHTVPAIETFSGNTWGAKGEAGFRFGTPHLYFEPIADLAWTTTHLDNANFPVQDTVFTFGNATSERGSIGARVGGQWGQILPYVGLYAAQEFDGKNKMSMITGGGCTGCDMDIQDLKPGAYERADFGFTTTSWNGLEGFLKGEAEFGGKTDGFTGRLGVRWRW